MTGPQLPRFDWPGLMRAGIGRLRLHPAQFWMLTPVELMLMLGLDPATPPMGRSRLAELARAFPDAAPQERTPDDRDRQS